jgi:ubiquitin carboxyl-terminal hydrolase 48
LEDLKVTEEEQEDPCDIVRKEGNFVGLTNLGATCYINSLLQLWFHNPIFRKAIYSWVPFFDPSEKENKTLDLLGMGGFIPNSPVGKLQLLFAQMQFSKRRYLQFTNNHLPNVIFKVTFFSSCVNPTSLITSLGIDTTTQQDAQEFSKLFLNLLEDKLSLQTDTTVSTMVYDQFRGEYEYVTR